jgi:type IV secretion system protein VirB8
VVPYTILVDRSSGYVETVKPLAPGPLTQNTVVTQSFLVQYVLARETFDASDLRNNYQKVMQWSAGDARASYQHEFDRTDPDSPLKLYSPTTTVSVAVENVAQLSPTTALVRFTTTRHEAGAPSGEQRAYTAVMAYHFSGAPMRMEDRFTNPLGFEVTRYRRDSDTVSGAALPAGATTP